jgi:replicative DNA helicase
MITHLYGGRLYSEMLDEGLKYIEDRMQGRIKSFKTPWVGFNQAGVGGLEWGSLLTLGARPGSGKTLVVSQILRESRIHNPSQDFHILEFQFEMGGKQAASRAFAAETALDYNAVLSTNKALDNFSFDLMKRHTSDFRALERQGIMRVVLSKPLSHADIRKTIYHYYEELGKATRQGSKPMIVTIDHSWLIKKGADEKEKIATLYNTVEMLMELKNDLPIIIIMITQLNRSMEEPSRKTPGIIGNYPTSSDIFGGDALMQGSDMVIALSRPAKADINVFGPKGYMVKGDDIFAHLLKVRNGADDKNILFMKAEFNKQRMIEVGEPVASNPSGNGYVRFSQQRTQQQSTGPDISNL